MEDDRHIRQYWQSANHTNSAARGVSSVANWGAAAGTKSSMPATGEGRHAEKN